jgi:vacuolar protein sorting-associated protein 3
VLTVVKSSNEARSQLAESYAQYRALRAPKPNYLQFITDHAIGESWWDNRLRLLQLLGGSHNVSYDVPSVIELIEPSKESLAPEMIILYGRQSRHEEALQLLTHDLGDYDAAMNYCLLGGYSIFQTPSSTVQSASVPSREKQAELFDGLLVEFLRIRDLSDRIEQTGALLDRFGGWLDVVHVRSTPFPLFRSSHQAIAKKYFDLGIDRDPKHMVDRPALRFPDQRLAWSRPREKRDTNRKGFKRG